MRPTRKNVLLIEDNEDHALLISRQLKDPNYGITLNRADSLSTAKAFLTGAKVDAILLDLYLPDSQGLETVTLVVKDHPMIPVIVLTSLNDERVALDALQHGAQDYLCKDELNGKMLFRAIRYSIERNRLIGIKDEFISTVSHELRTPLTSINGSLSLIVAEASAEQTMESALDLVKVAQRNCERLVRLVNDLLDIQKMEAGKYGITTEPVELVSLIKQAIESNAGYAHKYRVDLKFEADVQESWVTGDADKLSQVMSNLLSNAEKFSPKGSVVLVQLGSLETAARVSVADKGKGIPEALQSYLFEKFTQVDSSTRREKGGTGLGLSICKRIIELHGGQIGFSSTIGKGTTFSFELPVIAAPADESVL